MNRALLDALGGKSEVLVTLDFETFFSKDYTLRTLTTEAYIRDPRFEVLGVGVKVGNAPSVWLEEEDFRDWASRVDWSRVSLLAHHAHFDGFILSHHYGVRPRFWLCTLSMARALHGTARAGLEYLAPKYGVGAKGKELDNAKGKRRGDFTPEEFEALGGYCNNDVELTRAILDKMARGFPVEELWLIDTTIRAFTEPVFVADLAVLSKALTEEREKKARFLERSGATAEVLGSSDKFAALLRELGEEPPTKPSPKKKNPDGSPQMIPAFSKSDPGMQALLEHPDDGIRFLAEARLSVKSTIIETRTERLIGIAKRGPVPFYLRYCGAHTHRWSGGDKMNPQNFNRGGALRAAILAPPGHSLVVADSGQIEARVVAWLARQMELLETFRRNDAIDGDFYSDEGSRYFGRKLSKKETPVERQVAKSMVLGLGFQMGWTKFAGELLKGMLGAPPVRFTLEDAKRYGVDVHAFAPANGDEWQRGRRRAVETMISRTPFPERLIHSAVTYHFVQLYRRTNRKIADLWDRMKGALARMEPDQGPEVRGKYGPLVFKRHAIVKPGGLTLHYPGLKTSGSGFSYLGGKSGREHARIYGGLLTENVVQSLARDIVAEQALWIRAAGYRIGTTTHDEIVCVVPDSRAEECLSLMLQRMKTPPSWCADLPLNASGGIAKSYGDAK